MTPQAAIVIPWGVWFVSWVLAALWTERTLKRVDRAQQMPYRVLSLIAFVLLLVWVVRDPSGRRIGGVPMPDFLAAQVWMLPTSVNWAMVALAAGGFLFCWWARLHLGRLWSSKVTRKVGHHVVDTGPYRIVRHPIYTGILTAAAATALVKGTVHAILGFLLLVVAYAMKARLEERFLQAELGENAYASYRRRVPMLMPFGPTGG
jgi:protein-S-isoprenylcysteine O-methyltransferase Ste14